MSTNREPTSQKGIMVTVTRTWSPIEDELPPSNYRVIKTEKEYRGFTYEREHQNMNFRIIKAPAPYKSIPHKLSGTFTNEPLLETTVDNFLKLEEVNNARVSDIQAA
jgi:hypothetical protein